MLCARVLNTHSSQKRSITLFPLDIRAMNAMVYVLALALSVGVVRGFAPNFRRPGMGSLPLRTGASPAQAKLLQPRPGQQVGVRRLAPLRDLLGLGPAEIAITLVVALVLFGPETLKSLSKDVGKAAAELKEIPKTFKEGMDEGAEASQMSKMKAIAAEKRKKRDAADDDDDDSSSSVRPFEG